MRIHYKPTMDAATKNAVPKNGDTKIQEVGFMSNKEGVIFQDWLHKYNANTNQWIPIEEIREVTREEILSKQSTTNNHNPQSLVQKKTLPSNATTAKAMIAINSKKPIKLEQEKQILRQKQQKREEMEENLQQCRIDSSNKYPDGVAPGCNILGGRRRKQKSSRRRTTTRKRPKRSRAKRSTKRRRTHGRK